MKVALIPGLYTSVVEELSKGLNTTGVHPGKMISHVREMSLLFDLIEQLYRIAMVLSGQAGTVLGEAVNSIDASKGAE